MRKQNFRTRLMGVFAIVMACHCLGTISNATAQQTPTTMNNNQTLPPQRREDFMPLGVYWPGEWTFQSLGEGRWPKIEQTLDLLASRNVNAIWLTHLSAAETAEFARRAARRGIYLVASLAELSGEVAHVRQGDAAKHDKLVADTLETWGDAPLPIAWGLGDEPKTAYMDEMASFAAAWHRAKQPITTVILAHEVPLASQLLEAPFLCTDIYPYFSANNPNGPDSHAASTSYYLDAGQRSYNWIKQRPGAEWWQMGQIFQEVWGPGDITKNGDWIHLPGGGPMFRMPTPAEAKWQSWAAVARGARGFFYFSLLFANTPGPKTPALGPETAAWTVKQTVNSGSPGGMLYEDGRPTPQFEAMGQSFGRIAKVSKLLQTLEPIGEGDDILAFHAKGWIPHGDFVCEMRSSGGSRYAVVANGDLTKTREVPVNVRGEIVTGVTDMVSGQSIPLLAQQTDEWEPIGPLFRQARVKLEPGEGTLLRLEFGRQTANHGE